MPIHRMTNEFINQGKELLRELRTPQGNQLTHAEVRMLRLQLHLLDIEISNLQPRTHPFLRNELAVSSDQRNPKRRS
jgi:hypothetical protein